jgi:hypothetical protein
MLTPRFPSEIVFGLTFGHIPACLAMMVLFSASALAGTSPIDTSLPPLARVQAERTSQTAASSSTAPHLTTTAPARPDFEPAPLPNQDLVIPRGSPAPSGPALGAGLFRQAPGYRGDGYTQGSAAAQSEQPKRLPLPGLVLKVPLN